MNAEPEIPPPVDRASTAAGIRRRLNQIVVFFALQALILFLAAGRMNWPWAWVGSSWALVPGAAGTALMILRTHLEDRLLQAELPGYRDYVRDVRYRLVPGIW